jgi:hypothetical protein
LIKIEGGAGVIKPKLFTTESVQAILDGRKTQHRDVAKVSFLEGYNPQWTGYRPVIEYGKFFLEGSKHTIATKEVKLPYQPGDILWVREKWRERWGEAYANYGSGEAYPIDDVREIEYEAGGNGFFMGACNLCPDEPTIKFGEWEKWRPSIHMPKAVCRFWLKVKSVQVERLKDIMEEDAEREGVKAYGPNNCSGTSARIAFAEIWDTLYEKQGYGWDSNPWVWVIEFERTDKPEGWLV